MHAHRTRLRCHLQDTLRVTLRSAPLSHRRWPPGKHGCGAACSGAFVVRTSFSAGNRTNDARASTQAVLHGHLQDTHCGRNDIRRKARGHLHRKYRPRTRRRRTSLPNSLVAVMSQANRYTRTMTVEGSPDTNVGSHSTKKTKNRWSQQTQNRYRKTTAVVSHG